MQPGWAESDSRRNPLAGFEEIPMEMGGSARTKAQGLVEYGLIIALVAVLAIAGLMVFGPTVGSLLSRVSGSV
jgi:hypothetical protein